MDLNFETVAVGREAQEARVEIELRPRFLRGTSEARNQARAFDDQVGPCEGYLRGATVGEKFETANFVDHALVSGGAELPAEMIGDDESAGSGLEARLGFEHSNAAATLRDFRCGEKSGGRATYNHYVAVWPRREGIPFRSCHSVRSSVARGVWSRGIRLFARRNRK